MKDDFDLFVKTTFSLQMQTMSDFNIYQKAKEYGRIIIVSRDSDIEDIIITNGSPLKLINIKVGNCSNRFLYTLLKQHVQRALCPLIDFDKDIVHIEIND